MNENRVKRNSMLAQKLIRNSKPETSKRFTPKARTRREASLSP